MKKITLFIVLLTFIMGFSQEQKEIYQRAKINYQTSNDLTTLKNLGISIDHGIHKKGYYFISVFSKKEIEVIRKEGYQVDILIEDATADFLKRNKITTRQNEMCEDDNSTDYPTPANFSLGSMGGYFTYQEVLDQLDLMRTTYPNLITAKQNISTFLTEGQPDNSTTPSIGGNGIQWVKISDNPDMAESEPQVLYTSIHHAREPMCLSQNIFYMWYLLENYATNDEIKSIVDNTELYFVPVVNPDGYLYNELTDPNGGGFWRKNRKNGHGVDNNRNYDYHIDGDPNNGVWGGPGSSSDTNSDIYHGTGPFSEVENQAIKWFVENHNFVIALNNHTFGELLYYPHAYADVPTVEDDLFMDMSSEMVSQNGYNNLRGSPFAGDSDDFMYGTVGTHNKIYAFTPEIGTAFWMPSSEIIPVSKLMLHQNLTAARMVNNYGVITDNNPLFIGNSTTVNSDFSLKRLGVSGTSSFTVSINPISANITSVGAPVTFNNMTAFQESNDVITYQLDSGILSGDDIIFEYVVNNGAYDARTRVTKKFGELTTIFNEAGNNTSNFSTNVWGTTNATFVSPSTSITDSPNGRYQNNANEIITLNNSIDLTNATTAYVSFFARWEVESGFDYVQFEISTNNGNSWIPQCGKYTILGNNGGFQPSGEPLYSGNQTSWVEEEINLSDYLGENILMRFQLVSDGFARRDGFYFDDLRVSISDQSTNSTGDIALNEFSIYPNPVTDLLNIQTTLDRYTIEVYSIHGQLVASRSNNSNNTTLDYSTYDNGIYFLKLSDENTSEVFKIIKK